MECQFNSIQTIPLESHWSNVNTNIIENILFYDYQLKVNLYCRCTVKILL